VVETAVVHAGGIAEQPAVPTAPDAPAVPGVPAVPAAQVPVEVDAGGAAVVLAVRVPAEGAALDVPAAAKDIATMPVLQAMLPM
jgi:hypothetical protein